MVPYNIPLIFKQTFCHIMTTQSIQTVTVKQICAASHLSSRTFYNNFTDKYDLMHYSYYVLNEECWYEGGKPVSLSVAFDKTTEVIIRNQRMYKNFYSYVGQNDIRGFMLKKNRSDIVRLFHWNGYETYLKEKQVQQYITIMSLALAACLERWISYGENWYGDDLTFFSLLPEPYRDALLKNPADSKCWMKWSDGPDVNWPPKLFK